VQRITQSETRQTKVVKVTRNHWKRDVNPAPKNTKRIFRDYLNKLGACSTHFFSEHLIIEIPSPRYKAARFKKSPSVIKIWRSCDIWAKLRGGRCFTYILQITVRFSSRIWRLSISWLKKPYHFSPVSFFTGIERS
jgi:hypothetical protein